MLSPCVADLQERHHVSGRCTWTEPDIRAVGHYVREHWNNAFAFAGESILFPTNKDAKFFSEFCLAVAASEQPYDRHRLEFIKPVDDTQIFVFDTWVKLMDYQQVNRSTFKEIFNFEKPPPIWKEILFPGGGEEDQWVDWAIDEAMDIVGWWRTGKSIVYESLTSYPVMLEQLRIGDTPYPRPPLRLERREYNNAFAIFYRGVEDDDGFKTLVNARIQWSEKGVENAIEFIDANPGVSVDVGPQTFQFDDVEGARKFSHALFRWKNENRTPFEFRDVTERDEEFDATRAVVFKVWAELLKKLPELQEGQKKKTLEDYLTIPSRDRKPPRPTLLGIDTVSNAGGAKQFAFSLIKYAVLEWWNDGNSQRFKGRFPPHDNVDMSWGEVVIRLRKPSARQGAREAKLEKAREVLENSKSFSLDDVKKTDNPGRLKTRLQNWATGTEEQQIVYLTALKDFYGKMGTFDWDKDPNQTEKISVLYRLYQYHQQLRKAKASVPDPPMSLVDAVIGSLSGAVV